MPRGLIEYAIPAEHRLVRCVRRQQEHAVHARILEAVMREVDGNVAEERQRLHAATLADALTLRGLPAVSRAVAGVIRGTTRASPAREGVIAAA